MLEEVPRRGGRGFAVVPLTRGIPPKGGGGFAVVPLTRGIPRRGEGVLFFGVAPASLSGRKPPLIPPYQGGKKLSPFGVALLPFGKKPPLDPPLSGGQKLSPFGRVRPEGGRFVAVVPLTRGIPPKGGGGFVFRGRPCFPIGKKTPLNPPLSGGQKALPLIRGSTPKGGGGFVCSGSPLERTDIHGQLN